MAKKYQCVECGFKTPFDGGYDDMLEHLKEHEGVEE